MKKTAIQVGKVYASGDLTPLVPISGWSFMYARSSTNIGYFRKFGEFIVDRVIVLRGPTLAGRAFDAESTEYFEDAKKLPEVLVRVADHLHEQIKAYPYLSGELRIAQPFLIDQAKRALTREMLLSESLHQLLQSITVCCEPLGRIVAPWEEVVAFNQQAWSDARREVSATNDFVYERFILPDTELVRELRELTDLLGGTIALPKYQTREIVVRGYGDIQLGLLWESLVSEGNFSITRDMLKRIRDILTSKKEEETNE